ncbi:MAG: hypothetical protein JWM11_2142 [Planctomycetaceae bacterium]|nr:hypothetical protein [Planctomycetaceae bacterium]
MKISYLLCGSVVIYLLSMVVVGHALDPKEATTDSRSDERLKLLKKVSEEISRGERQSALKGEVARAVDRFLRHSSPHPEKPEKVAKHCGILVSEIEAALRRDAMEDVILKVLSETLSSCAQCAAKERESLQSRLELLKTNVSGEMEKVKSRALQRTEDIAVVLTFILIDVRAGSQKSQLEFLHDKILRKYFGRMHQGDDSSLHLLSNLVQPYMLEGCTQLESQAKALGILPIPESTIDRKFAIKEKMGEKEFRNFEATLLDAQQMAFMLHLKELIEGTSKIEFLGDAPSEMTVIELIKGLVTSRRNIPNELLVACAKYGKKLSNAGNVKSPALERIGEMAQLELDKEKRASELVNGSSGVKPVEPVEPAKSKAYLFKKKPQD